ncbi:MAG: LuxR family transcriptional regulator [Sulfuricellaceae bacterium]
MREIFFNARGCDDGGGHSSALLSFESLLEARTLEELAVLVRRASRSLGFEHFLYGVWLDAPRSRGKGAERLQFVFSGYPEAWIETYQKRDYLSIDPVIEHCSGHATPLVWRDGIFDTAARREFWEEARGAGLASGVSVPLRGTFGESGLFNLANSSSNSAAVRHCAAAAEKAYLLSAYLHEALQNLVFQPEGYALRARPSLTEREQACLVRWADGLAAEDIADLLNLSGRTVRFHLENVKDKLGVCDKGRAIACALQWGLIRYR